MSYIIRLLGQILIFRTSRLPRKSRIRNSGPRKQSSPHMAGHRPGPSTGQPLPGCRGSPAAASVLPSPVSARHLSAACDSDGSPFSPYFQWFFSRNDHASKLPYHQIQFSAGVTAFFLIYVKIERSTRLSRSEPAFCRLPHTGCFRLNMVFSPQQGKTAAAPNQNPAVGPARRQGAIQCAMRFE